MYNRADNLEQPTAGELYMGNILMQGDEFLLVENVYPDYWEGFPLLGEKIVLRRYEYKYTIGVDLKNWIINHGLMRVIDVLLRGNGFKKDTSLFLNPSYYKGDFSILCRGNWLVGDTPVSFLHEVQNLYRERTGEDMRIEGVF